MSFSVDNEPIFKEGEAQEIVLSATEGEEGVTGMNITGKLEMAKMDHGVIEATFSDNGDGTYRAEADLPMGGEWMMDMEAEKDGETYEEVITFQVSE